jgi:hypothetical protein
MISGWLVLDHPGGGTMRPLLLLAPTALVGAVLLPPAQANAGIQACGDIFVEAGAECELVPPGANCDVRCTPLSVEAACAAQLQIECAGQCSADATIDCAATCQGSCEADCTVDPGRFDCRAACQADCDGSCRATCATNDGECQASCQATCSASCDGECEVVPASADCSAQCEASCSGYCEADANIECQVTCQSSGYLDCRVDVEGGCEAACDLREGALFCDGQFIDHDDNLVECIDALEDLLDIRVEGYARGECDDGVCEGEAGGSLSCGVGRPGGAGGAWTLIALAALAGAGRARRRRRGAR